MYEASRSSASGSTRGSLTPQKRGTPKFSTPGRYATSRGFDESPLKRTEDEGTGKTRSRSSKTKELLLDENDRSEEDDFSIKSRHE